MKGVKYLSKLERTLASEKRGFPLQTSLISDLTGKESNFIILSYCLLHSQNFNDPLL